MNKKVLLIKKSKGITRKISQTYKVTNFLTKDECRNLSVGISNAKKHKEITENIKSDRVYYILKGKLVVKSTNKNLIVQKGDILFIPKNTKYQFQGTFKAILINSPAFNANDEKIIEMEK